VALGLAAAALLLAASVAAVLVTEQPDAATGPGTPGGTVAAYTTAYAEGRLGDAWDLLSPRGRAGMSREDFIQFGGMGGASGERLEIRGVTETGDTAIVRVTYVATYGALESRQDGTVEVRRVDGEWWIDSPMYGGLMPMPDVDIEDF
jgi:opacity protein-like surface antigen